MDPESAGHIRPSSDLSALYDELRSLDLSGSSLEEMVQQLASSYQRHGRIPLFHLSGAETGGNVGETVSLYGHRLEATPYKGAGVYFSDRPLMEYAGTGESPIHMYVYPGESPIMMHHSTIDEVTLANRLGEVSPKGAAADILEASIAAVHQSSYQGRPVAIHHMEVGATDASTFESGLASIFYQGPATNYGSMGSRLDALISRRNSLLATPKGGHGAIPMSQEYEAWVSSRYSSIASRMDDLIQSEIPKAISAAREGISQLRGNLGSSLVSRMYQGEYIGTDLARIDTGVLGLVTSMEKAGVAETDLVNRARAVGSRQRMLTSLSTRSEGLEYEGRTGLSALRRRQARTIVEARRKMRQMGSQEEMRQSGLARPLLDLRTEALENGVLVDPVLNRRVEHALSEYNSIYDRLPGRITAEVQEVPEVASIAAEVFGTASPAIESTLERQSGKAVGVIQRGVSRVRNLFRGKFLS